MTVKYVYNVIYLMTANWNIYSYFEVSKVQRVNQHAFDVFKNLSLWRMR